MATALTVLLLFHFSLIHYLNKCARTWNIFIYTSMARFKVALHGIDERGKIGQSNSSSWNEQMKGFPRLELKRIWETLKNEGLFYVLVSVSFFVYLLFVFSLSYIPYLMYMLPSCISQWLVCILIIYLYSLTNCNGRML